MNSFNIKHDVILKRDFNIIKTTIHRFVQCRRIYACIKFLYFTENFRIFIFILFFCFLLVETTFLGYEKINYKYIQETLGYPWNWMAINANDFYIAFS